MDTQIHIYVCVPMGMQDFLFISVGISADQNALKKSFNMVF